MLNLKSEVEFKEWPKIPRGQHENVTITEKIDGTNACIIIEEGEIVGIQSRKRMLVPAALSGEKDTDNFGFAFWVMENEEDLLQLGDGYHYGEWAGPGIQKNPHGLREKMFFLFNTARWNLDNPNKPSCCNVVPILYSGEYTDLCIEDAMNLLKGCYVHPDQNPEGIVVYYHKTRRLEKHTFATQKGKWSKGV
jgi:hypothetical protein